jgi:deazaflavin-dependent oxidoreductase (nitroreductase family)
MPGPLSWFLRRLTKYVFNPITLKTAGRDDDRYAALHHIGRKSGRAYVTPVAAEPIVGGFVITLPYGVNTDWCRNVFAAGEATLDVRGETVGVIDPRVVDLASIEDQIQPGLVRGGRRLRIRQYLRVDRAPPVRGTASNIHDQRIASRVESGGRTGGGATRSCWHLKTRQPQRA